jgi:membrane protein required for colicin V production
VTEITALDYAILGALALGVWRGTRTGAIRQVVGLVGVLVAFWLAVLLMAPAGRIAVLVGGVPESVAPVAGFVLVATFVLVALIFIGFAARKTLEVMRLGFLDGGLGGLLGGARAAVLLSLLLLVTSSQAVPLADGLLVRSETRERSILYEPVRAVAPMLWDGFRILIPGWQDGLMKRFERLGVTSFVETGQPVAPSRD